jgi:putative two-component system response regulator
MSNTKNSPDSNEYNAEEIDYILRESINSIIGMVDQLHYGILNFMEEDEKETFIANLKGGADSLQNVISESIVAKANKISDLNDHLVKNNTSLRKLKRSLEKKVAERTRQIKEIQHVTIFALARLAESRDPDAGDHLDRIRLYSYILTRQLGTKDKYSDYITTKYINNVYHSSPLHDIGKVGINDSILLKPGKLSREEFDVMKTHTTIGGKTLEDAEKQLQYKTKSFLSMGREIAYCHHEKWNGSGYPFGLKGEKIPLSARVLAVADVYDALTSKRVYKDAMGHDETRQMIVDQRGEHFDPEIVDVFIELEEKFRMISTGNITNIKYFESL